MKQLTVLGSTGSIGCSTLDVVRHNPGRFSVAALVAGKNVDRMVEQCLEFTPRYAVMDDAQSAERLRTRLHEHGCRTEVLSGQQAAAEVAALDEVDQVMAAIVGAAGLVPVDLYIPGCPPHPITILDGLLRLLGRHPAV